MIEVKIVNCQTQKSLVIKLERPIFIVDVHLHTIITENGALIDKRSQKINLKSFL